MAQDVTRPSLSDALTERVLELIRAGGLRPGDRLPSARELSERFAVTTPTLREALRRLEATGAVQMRHGSGIYVGADLERVVIPNPNFRRLQADQMLQLLDARLLIEPPLAAMTARRADPADLDRLGTALDQAGRHLEGEDAELDTANRTFHRAAARASGNAVLGEVIDSLLSVHASEQREILRIFDDRARDHDEHRAILAAMKAGDAERAEELMRAHLLDVKSVIESRLT
ncbi:FadR family transcriptional regulator [Actinomadura barringtoniae]|uniref:FadR family transcriptional regulator n=1 Tax=Actinomadura barringtoniae TaxID=1427535 RepID=A0A939PKN9_9ACTN|nr:FadR/GntR family transcriptional regulator [Actinomadura barringtoniae]MBO2450331.1 FadR family transcriptional regulator [Actinomadura barringtoniae]